MGDAHVLFHMLTWCLLASHYKTKRTSQTVSDPLLTIIFPQVSYFFSLHVQDRVIGTVSHGLLIFLNDDLIRVHGSQVFLDRITHGLRTAICAKTANRKESFRVRVQVKSLECALFCCKARRKW